MKKLFITATVALLLGSTPVLADSGFYLGTGAFSADIDVCDTCDGTGWFVEGGQRMSRHVTAEMKLAYGDLDDRDGNVRMAYFGANVSPAIGPTWLDVYGKAGVLWTDMRTTLRIGTSEAGDPVYGTNGNKEFGLSYGLGLRFTPMQRWYGQIEAMSSNYDGDDILKTTLSFGLMF